MTRSRLSSVPRDILASIAERRARDLFVILAERTDSTITLVKSPVTNKPWYSTNRRMADKVAADVARETPGVRKAAAVNLEEALRRLTGPISL